jgi:hypothetical protein
MKTNYTILFYGFEGTLVRVETQPCADLRQAIRFAVQDNALCSRYAIYANSRTVWTGSPAEAERFLTKRVAEEEETGLHI